MSPDDARLLFQGTPIHRLYGMQLDVVNGGVDLHGSADDDLARVEGLPMLHGGAVAAMLDTAATFALMTSTDRRWATVDLRIDYLAPSPLRSLTLRGRVIKAGGRIGRARAELLGADGTQVAIAVGTFAAEADRTPS